MNDDMEIFDKINKCRNKIYKNENSINEEDSKLYES